MKKLADDNFGDHKNTGIPRVDGDLRAPLDMGKGSLKHRVIACPKCKIPMSVKRICRGTSCPSCKKWFDPKDCEDFKGIRIESDAPHIPKLSKEYMNFRHTSEKQAESYAKGSKKKFF